MLDIQYTFELLYLVLDKTHLENDQQLDKNLFCRQGIYTFEYKIVFFKKIHKIVEYLIVTVNNKKIKRVE